MKSKTPKPEKIHFSDEALDSFINLGVILNKIHKRLLMEGYAINDDGIFPPKDKVVEVSKGKRKAKN